MSRTLVAAALGVPLVLYLLYLYIAHNDRCLSALPPAAAKHSPQRYTLREILDTRARVRASPVDVADALPPKTGQRYIVVGGAGFLGGWIVVHLLLRGEDPRHIRVLDIRAPTRKDLTTGTARLVDFRVVDIADAAAVRTAFAAPWPDTSDRDGDSEREVTVFHTAANIRFFERTASLAPRSARVNVAGTAHVIAAARAVGARTLVYTSSGSVCVRRSRFWLWPWEDAPPHVVQVIDDEDEHVPVQHGEFFSNYAWTKKKAEELVRKTDGCTTGVGWESYDTGDFSLDAGAVGEVKGKEDIDCVRPAVMRTGCIRPGNGIFGPGGDVLCGATLVRRTNPTWVPNVLQNFVYVENCSLAHLCYEARLIAVERQRHAGHEGNTATGKEDASTAGQILPDIGGQAFCVADPNPPPTYGDVYAALNALSGGRATFTVLSPTLMLALAQLFEVYYLSRFFLTSPPIPALLRRIFSTLIPQLGGDLVNLQPSLFALVMVHLIFDDSRARRPPELGGLGYTPLWTTLEGLCKLVDEFDRSGGEVEERQRAGGGVSLGFGLGKAERGVGNVVEELKSVPEKALN